MSATSPNLVTMAVDAAASVGATRGVVPVTTIAPGRRAAGLGLRELSRYRDLLYFLALRDIQVRYKQTALGILWAVLQPLVTMAALSLFFGQFVGLSERTAGLPYHVFVFAGLIPWTFFSAAVNAASNSLISSAPMLRKVYFPRLIVPLASIGAPLIDMAIALAVLLVLMVMSGVPWTARLLLTPIITLTAVAAALGVGLLFASLTAVYRDFRYVASFVVQVLFFLTPVIYPVSVVPYRWHWALSLNPAYGTIDAFRAAFLGAPISVIPWAISTIVSLLLLWIGLMQFARVERRLADTL